MITIIKLGASWCAPCGALDKTIDQFKNTNTDVVFTKIDTDADSEAIRRYSIRGLPTIIKLDEAGLERSRKSGAMSLAELTKFVYEDK